MRGGTYKVKPSSYLISIIDRNSKGVAGGACWRYNNSLRTTERRDTTHTPRHHAQPPCGGQPAFARLAYEWSPCTGLALHRRASPNPEAGGVDELVQRGVHGRVRRDELVAPEANAAAAPPRSAHEARHDRRRHRSRGGHAKGARRRRRRRRLGWARLGRHGHRRAAAARDDGRRLP